jgi:antitoxin (DNA-binding transcriptional repressor) of toxin-antitoxin stability system
MKVSISNFRKNLFQLVDRALNGEVIEVEYKGNTVRLVRQEKGSKLDKLIPAEISNPQFSAENHENASRELFAEMQREWETDWSEL